MAKQKVTAAQFNRVIASAHNVSAPGGAQSATITFDTVDVDTHGAFNGASGLFTVPVAGFYYVNFGGFSDVGASAGGIHIQRNGTNLTRQYSSNSGSIYVPISINLTFECAVGDTIRIDSDFAMHKANACQISIIYMGAA